MSKPLRPPITYFGSKSNLARHITKHFPLHHTYVDVFGGSGAVLLAKPSSRVDVYNDINDKLHALFNALRDPEKSKLLIDKLYYTPYSRAEFTRCKASIDAETDEVEIARQMFVLHRQSHSGEGKSWSYCVEASSSGYSCSVRKYHAGIDRLSMIASKLRRTQLENLPWEQVIERYDRPDTLFYLDPPYVPCTRSGGGYKHEMSRADHARLVDKLLTIKGKAVLSGYPNDIYLTLEDSGWQRIDITTTSRASNKRDARTECLWISPNAKQSQQKLSRSQAAYRTHEMRVSRSEQQIVEAIRMLQQRGERVSKAQVARVTGMSRTQISRRYAHLFA